MCREEHKIFFEPVGQLKNTGTRLSIVDFLCFFWPCIIMHHNNVTNLTHFHFHKHFVS
jgi:hypothetical protein